jgi:hypothetical protein
VNFPRSGVVKAVIRARGGTPSSAATSLARAPPFENNIASRLSHRVLGIEYDCDIVCALNYRRVFSFFTASMVSPVEWGPNAWKLLHGIAERIGNQSSMTLVSDERNELKLTLRHFWALLPCQKCQKHYKEWLIKHPPDSWIVGPFGCDLQDSMRYWVYLLHEDVNQRREVISGINLESLEETYKDINLREQANALKSMYQRGLLIRVLNAETWKIAWKHLDLLIRLIG